MDDETMTERDIAYVETQYIDLPSLCRQRGWPLATVRREIDEGRLPAPSYQLPDGRMMVPGDYLDRVAAAAGVDLLPSYFAGRYADPEDFDEVWATYIEGTWGICLRRVTPENIRRKGQLVELLQKLLGHPAPNDRDWTDQLVAAVTELDALERPFAPDCDRTRFGRPPTRDTLIEEPRRNFPSLFAREAKDVA
jgi:hypothetical protein